MKYLIEFNNQKADALFEYDKQGHLIAFTLNKGSFEDKHFDFLYHYLPVTIGIMEQWQKSKQKNCIIRKMDEDLSFERFYKLYDQKFGKKQRSKTLWEQLPDTEKAKAIAYIPKYNQYLQSGVAKKMPETYLNQQIWNN